MTGLLSDIRHALRTARRHPLAVAAAVLSVAICTGPSCALFSVVTSVLLRPWSVEKPDELVSVFFKRGNRYHGLSYQESLDVGERSRSLAGITVWDRRGALMKFQGRTEVLPLCVVSRNYFAVLGVRPAVGRFFSPSQNPEPGGELEVVIGYRLWVNHFNKAPTTVGSTIYLTDQAFVVVGVAPPGFRGLDWQLPTDLWVTLDSRPAADMARYLRRDTHLESMGRVREGVTIAQARAELRQIARQLGEEYPETNKVSDVLLVEAAKEQQRVGIVLSGILMSLVSLVLFIACANLANLLLAHAASQRHETAVRAALGAGRFRLFRQFLTESMLISIAGTAVGLLLAAWLIPLLNQVKPFVVISVDYDVGFGRGVPLYGLFLAFATALAFGAWPAFQACRRDLLADLNATGPGFAQTHGRTPILKLLLILQIAVAQFLVAGAFVFVSNFSAALKTNLGLDVDRNLLLATLVPSGGSTRMDWEEIADQVRGIPGVLGATYAGSIPLSGSGGMQPVKISLPGAEVGESTLAVPSNLIGPGYFGVMGTRILAGRDITRQDLSPPGRVVAVNEAAARGLWPDTPLNEVVGKQIRVEAAALRIVTQVVAVVENGKYASFYEPQQKYMFLPFSGGGGEVALIVECKGDPGALTGTVRRELQRAFPNLDFLNATTMKQNLRLARGVELGASTLLGVLGALAILLACVGLYGNASYAASFRTRELAIRMALGAQRRDVLWLCLRQSCRIALPGLAMGMLAAYALARIVARATLGAAGANTLVFLISFALIGSISILATFIPAYRATCADLMTVLRAE